MPFPSLDYSCSTNKSNTLRDLGSSAEPAAALLAEPVFALLVVAATVFTASFDMDEGRVEKPSSSTTASECFFAPALPLPAPAPFAPAGGRLLNTAPFADEASDDVAAEDDASVGGRTANISSLGRAPPKGSGLFFF